MKTISGNSIMVRQINREIIRDALKACEHANIAELARMTGLSVATCANILPELVESGEVLELERQSQGGRPARTFAYNPDCTLVAAILLRDADGAAVARYSVRNTAGTVLAQGEETYDAVGLDCLDDLIAGLTARFAAIRALAVSVPGVVHNGEIELCDISELIGLSLEKALRDRHGLEVVVENDMNFAAAGFYRAHAGTLAAGVGYIVFPGDKCPGSGLVVNGRLLKGRSGFAGELSFIPFDGSRRDADGGRGSREQAVAAAARLVAAVIAVVNPDVVVLSGAAMEEGMLPEIKAACLEAVPERHMPELVMRPDYEDDCFAGMAMMGHNRLLPEVQLVERAREWCGE